MRRCTFPKRFVVLVYYTPHVVEKSVFVDLPAFRPTLEPKSPIEEQNKKMARRPDACRYNEAGAFL